MFDYKNGNFNDLKDSLANVPSSLASSVDIDEFRANWKNLFSSAVKDHIPIKVVHDKNSTPWIDTKVHRLIWKKYTALKQYRKNKTPECKQELRTLSQKTKLLV